MTRRENTGSGFFTWLAADRNGAALTGHKSVLGNVVAAIDGLQRPVLIALFVNKDGFVHMLEATAAGESTVEIDFSSVRFTLNPPY